MIATDRIERLPWPWVRGNGLAVRWFNGWTTALDEALEELPESAECPHELLISLMRNPSSARKCAALVTKDNRPVALIALRRIGVARWDLIGGGGVSPRFLAPAVDGYFFPALSALGVSVHVATQPQPPPNRWVQSVEAHPVFRIALTSNFEAYWKMSGHLKTVRQARNRTQDFVFELDGPGAAEWTIRGWANQWRGRYTVSEDDLVLAAAYYRNCGRFHTIRLLEGGEPVSGNTFLVYGRTLLAISTFTRPEYRKLKAGTRALDMVFDWAASTGFQEIDLGVGHDYKSRWAPSSGTRWSFDVRPWHLHVAADVARRGLAVGRVTMKAARRVLGARGFDWLRTQDRRPGSLVQGG